MKRKSERVDHGGLRGREGEGLASQSGDSAGVSSHTGVIMYAELKRLGYSFFHCCYSLAVHFYSF